MHKVFQFFLRHDSIVVDIISAPDLSNNHLNALSLISRLVGYQQIGLEITLLCMNCRGCQKSHAQLVPYLIQKLIKV